MLSRYVPPSNTPSVGTTRDWEIIAPVDDSHMGIVDEIGPKIGRAFHGPLMHYVTGGQLDESGALWIASYYAQMQRLNGALEVDFTPNIAYQAPARGNGIAYLQDMSLTTDSSKLLLAVSYAHHCVKVYDRETGQLISTIGIPNGAGNIADGRLYNPHSALRLSNGNIVVSSYNGRGDGATNHGSLTEWDVSTAQATLVATRMAFVSGGQSAVGTNIVYRPMRIIWDNDGTHIWVSEYGRGRILKVNIQTWITEDILNAPSGVGTIGGSYGLTQLQDGTIVVASNSKARIVGINPVTKAEVFTIDPADYGASQVGLRGVFEIKPGYIAWADWNTQAIYVTRVADVTIQFAAPSVPSGWQIEGGTLPDYLDADTYQASARPFEVAQMSKPIPILKREIT